MLLFKSERSVTIELACSKVTLAHVILRANHWAAPFTAQNAATALQSLHWPTNCNRGPTSLPSATHPRPPQVVASSGAHHRFPLRILLPRRRRLRLCLRLPFNFTPHRHSHSPSSSRAWSFGCSPPSSWSATTYSVLDARFRFANRLTPFLQFPRAGHCLPLHSWFVLRFAEEGGTGPGCWFLLRFSEEQTRNALPRVSISLESGSWAWASRPSTSRNRCGDSFTAEAGRASEPLDGGGGAEGAAAGEEGAGGDGPVG